MIPYICGVPDPEVNIFAYPELRRFLIHVRDRVPVTSLGGWDGGNALILRHDVDLSIEAAYALAMLEHECGVTSSFFFLTTCPFYNPLASTSRRMLQHMTSLGFEVGLHFDPAAYDAADAAELHTHLDEEAGVLALASGAPVTSISLHNPSIRGEFPLFEGYRNAYDPSVFSPGRYLSDSRMVFAGGDIYEFAAQAANSVVQLLLHPLHYSDHGGGYESLFSQYARTLIEAVDGSFRDNDGYCMAMPGSLLDAVRNSPRDR